MSQDLMILCLECSGELVDHAKLEEEECPTCEGGGFLTEGDEEFPCPSCDMMGTVEYHPKCQCCKGTGWMPNPDIMV